MGSVGAPKRVRDIPAELPDDLVQIIFSKLDFKSKVMAGQVCKRWDQLLKAPIAGARHWAVDYDLDTIVSSQALTSAEQEPIVKQFKATIGRWLVKRAAAINVVRVSATLSSDPEGLATMNVLQNQLPLLAGCLAKHANRLELTFHRGSPFASPLLSSSAFLTFLCPMLKSLSLVPSTVPITASQFAAICGLSGLEHLHIETEDDGEGLQEMTADISKLVNLRVLDLDGNKSLDSIPESISCLQKLEIMSIVYSPISEVPSGLASLTTLSELSIMTCHDEPLRFPSSLQGLTSLISVSLEGCSLEMIPEVLTGLSALTYMDLTCNKFRSRDGWSWWPTTLSRLTKLAELVIEHSCIVSLPPHISGLRQLTMLDISNNNLRSLPKQLSSLQNLRALRAECNRLSTVPVSVLSGLTALTNICLCNQHPGGSATFKVSSSLLPVLHPGLVKLDLFQYKRAWDTLSLCHLGHAMAEVADRTPDLTLTF